MQQHVSQLESVLRVYPSPEARRSRPALPGVGPQHPTLMKCLDERLFQPAREMHERPSHSFRPQLVEAGFHLTGRRDLSAQDKANLAICADSIEFLHLGSLIVDDIQDGSPVRRNGQALHCLLGTPHALGVGNWLYFHALKGLRSLDLSEPALKLLYETYHEAVEEAHYGQIIDLTVRVDEVGFSHIAVLSHECMRYKTGSIVMLALVLGAIVAGADPATIESVRKLGYALGIYLQRLNDLGNCFGDFDNEKKWEDLINRKPSFVWGFVANNYGADALQQLIEASRTLPQAQAFQAWLAQHDLCEEARALAEKDWESALRDFCAEADPSRKALRTLYELKERIRKAYA